MISGQLRPFSDNGEILCARRENIKYSDKINTVLRTTTGLITFFIKNFSGQNYLIREKYLNFVFNQTKYSSLQWIFQFVCRCGHENAKIRRKGRFFILIGYLLEPKNQFFRHAYVGKGVIIWGFTIMSGSSNWFVRLYVEFSVTTTQLIAWKNLWIFSSFL